ncbi:uncharacterized protein B0P05DRAFT_551030 [Gilbertella persicaria]|uniref:uncharacterized protein n=1 Tax=Gilbertella persicaria TaxID=101096 RepID=UPI00221F586A|nr:uncharacterized protein B0P05DRAFT_551030 [Gilbertella persicaria]KAI8069817.1 hypothetical protein B0P05DRAFT_551030 [Gilbertella persicaria]
MKCRVCIRVLLVYGALTFNGELFIWPHFYKGLVSNCRSVKERKKGGRIVSRLYTMTLVPQASTSEFRNDVLEIEIEIYRFRNNMLNGIDDKKNF